MGIHLTETQASKIIEITDEFSRWEEDKGEGKIYHANTHMAALQWATNILRENQKEIDGVIIDLQTNLERIKQQLTQEQQPQETDPFYFRSKDKRFVLRGIDKMWSEDIKNIFIQTVVRPSPYLEIIKTIKEISTYQINIGIFTRGDPCYQLLKVLELLKQHPDLPISQIWLTRVPKGDFIVEAIEVMSKLKQEHSVVVVVDDSPKELSSILSANERLEATPFSLAVVRSKRENTKEYDSNGEGEPELDFTGRSFSPSDILNTLLDIIYVNIKTRLGEQHPETLRLQNKLRSRRVDVS